MADTRLVVASRTEAIEWGAMVRNMSDEDIVDVLAILNTELEKVLGQRLYIVLAALILRRKLAGKWLP